MPYKQLSDPNPKNTDLTGSLSRNPHHVGEKLRKILSSHEEFPSSKHSFSTCHVPDINIEYKSIFGY